MLSGARPPWAARYGAAALAVALAFLLKVLLDPFLQEGSPFFLLSAAVLVAAAYGGLGPGIFATMLGAVAGDYLFLPPVGTLVPPSAEHGLTTGLFVAQGLAISAVGAWLAEARRRAEEGTRRAAQSRDRLAESEERFRRLVEAAKDYAIFMTDAEGRVTTWNEGAERLFGYGEAEILGQDASLLFTPEDREGGRPERELELAAEEGRAEDERWHVRKDGTRFWASGYVRPVRGEGGGLLGFSKVARDETERRRANEALRESEERYRAVIGQAAEGIYLLDAETGRIVETNPAFQRMLGYSGEELRGTELHDLINLPREEVDAVLRRELEEGHLPITERLYRRKDGTLMDAEVGASVIRDGGGRLVCAVVRDVTERKRAEEVLREIREAERSRIARDLHDGPLQDLAYGVAEMHIAGMDVADDHPAAASVGRASGALGRVAAGLRAAVHDLRLGGERDRPLAALVEALVQRERSMDPGRDVRLEVREGFPTGPAGDAGAEVLRVVGEALTNARRHSGAKNVRVSLGVEDADLVAEVSDDGRGFGPETAPGVGRGSMRERAAAIGGALEVESDPGEGTRVRLRVPVSEDLRNAPRGETGNQGEGR